MAEKAFIVEQLELLVEKEMKLIWHPADLGAKVLDEIVSRLDMDPELVDDVIFGCVDWSSVRKYCKECSSLFFIS